MFSVNEVGQSADAQIGNLLVQAGMITEDILDIALQITYGFGETLIQVLVDTKRLSVLDVHNALVAQSWIESGLVDKRTVISTLNSSHKKRVTINELARTVGRYAA